MTNFYFDVETVIRILRALQEGKKDILVSLDLNLTEKLWPIQKDRLILDPDVSIDRKMLEAVASRRNIIFRLRDNALTPLEIRSHAYYKLSPTRTAPILEIDGIKMHRSKEMDPLADAQKKTRMVVSTGDTVLDTCGGLGYSAFFALKAGAKKVISTEKSHEVIQLRNLNPWLKKWNGDALEFVHADITQYIDGMESNMFNSVIHDPPRFTSKTGDLYGKKFYEGLFRVMAPRSKLFHYTGIPKKIKTGDRFVVNTIKRLEASGFHSVMFKDDLQGVFAKKD
ncbi:MAG: hypothetical protein NDI81_02825 [Desulfobacula sp.]|nr:hypothetical protein [Desulfobacula sp.]MDA8133079.1 hypothetical protein [Desulfobacteraceae bacterium]